jgi:multidrug efflux system membrane fusion protein
MPDSPITPAKPPTDPDVNGLPASAPVHPAPTDPDVNGLPTSTPVPAAPPNNVPKSEKAPDGEKAPAGKTKPGRRRWPWVLVVLLLLGVGAYFLWSKISGAKSSAAAKAAAAGPPPIPVVVTKSRTGDIGVYYTGLGAVTPLATVTVKTRVDGQLVSVRYKEGDTVKQGDLLVEIDDGPYQAALTVAQGQLIRDQALLDNARIDLARYQKLVPLEAVPEQMLATQVSLVQQDEGIVKLDQGQVASAQVNLAYCKIAAPVAGRIGLRLVDAGNIVHATDTTGLVVITQMDPISVVFTIAEDQLQVVLKKMAAGQTLEVDAYDRTANTKIAQGSLTTLDNQIDPTTGTLKLRAIFANAMGTLFPNQFVNARLLVQEKHGVTLVPTAAIQKNSNATYVYVVKADSTVTLRPITVDTAEGDDTQVTSGLMPGEVLVMTGVDKLEEGSKVSVQAPSANAPAGAAPAAKPAAKPSAQKTGNTPKGK